MPDMACIGMDSIGIGEADAGGGIVQCPIAACSGEHAGVAGLAADMQWPMAACAGGHAGSAAGGVVAGIAMPGIACRHHAIGVGIGVAGLPVSCNIPSPRVRACKSEFGRSSRQRDAEDASRAVASRCGAAFMRPPPRDAAHHAGGHVVEQAAVPGPAAEGTLHAAEAAARARRRPRCACGPGSAVRVLQVVYQAGSTG